MKDLSTIEEDIQTVDGDPMNVQLYTLDNGMRLYMCVMDDEPRIQTFIATRAGSKNDPSDATGLAHYLEHMLFKGSSNIAALDWKTEKKILDKIAALYEKHRVADLADRASIYKEIDSLSFIAAKLVAANEYDKMISSLGAKGTNAFTSLDRTAYVNNIPSNELEKWLKIESERFSELVLRLFHTELEAVYEEFNISQNNDSRKMYKVMLENLCPSHPYGTQTTIGTGEHLKTPSMNKIHEFFDKYYIPNNMAVVLAGDFDPKEAIQLVEKYFGNYKKKKLNLPSFESQKPVQGPIIKEVFGREKERVQMAWRLPGVSHEDIPLANLVGNILYNGSVGLMDVNLLQKQLIGQRAYAGTWAVNDYSFFMLYGEPREGQGLNDTRDLMLKEVKKLRDGLFDDWMIEAIINDMEYSELKKRESSTSIAYVLLDAFISDQPWDKYVREFETLRSFTKDDIVRFANQYLNDNQSVTVYKKEGDDASILQVEKPSITPVQVNRDTVSSFRSELDQMVSPDITPVFPDFKKKIQKNTLESGLPFHYVKNNKNETFEFQLIIEMGEYADNVLPVAINFIPFLGTEKYSPEDLKAEFYKLGIKYYVYTSGEVCYINMEGLDRNFEKGLQLLESLLKDPVAEEEALENMKVDLLKNRLDEKKDKRSVLNRAMSQYAKYGNNTPFNMRLQPDLITGISSHDLLKRIRSLSKFEHTVYYHGSKSEASVRSILNANHVSGEFEDCIPNRVFREVETDKEKVFFVHFPGMAQAEILMLAKINNTYDVSDHIVGTLYNQYFGSGLSSVVFQEIREARALAYSARAYFMSPRDKSKGHYLQAYVGTQSDKMKDAIQAMRDIIEDMPVSDDQIQNAVAAKIKEIKSTRVDDASIYWIERSMQKRGLEKNLNQLIYDQLIKVMGDKNASKEMLIEFHRKNVKGRPFTTLVLGDRDKIDVNHLKTLGQYKELTMEELFGF